MALEPGRNLWRLSPAWRPAFLINGEAYFSAFRSAATRARKSIVIPGWDLDSRVELVRRGSSDGYPSKLGDFLNAVVRRRREVHVLLVRFLLGEQRK